MAALLSYRPSYLQRRENIKSYKYQTQFHNLIDYE
jgi:hypothetical protein